MLIFLDLLTNETIDLETYEIDIIKYTKKGIQIKDTEGNMYLCDTIETQ